MALPYRVADLEDVPESARELYEEDDDGFRLPVDGVRADDEVEGLESALRKLKEEKSELKKRAERVSDADLEELEELRAKRREIEEKKAAEEGKLDELREKWRQETESKVGEKDQVIAERDRVIEKLAVTSELRSAIAEAGVPPEYQKAVELLLKERGPKVKMDDGDPVGVFPDEVHGDKPIPEFVAEWAKTDEAKAYLPPSNKGGGGASGRDGGDVSIDKKWADMTPEEKVAYTGQKYGDATAA